MKLCIYIDVLSKERLAAFKSLISAFQKLKLDYNILIEENLATKQQGKLLYFQNLEKLKKHLPDIDPKKLKIIHSSSGENLEDYILTKKNRLSVIRSYLSTIQPTKLFIWNGLFKHQEDFLTAVRNLGLQTNLVFIESGWFPQANHIYFDFKGVNYRSSISDYAKNNLKLNLLQKRKVQSFLKGLSVRKTGKTSPKNSKPILFVPLQVDTDTSIKHFSPFKSMKQFIEYLEEWIPDNQFDVIIRPHPKAKYSYPLISKREDFRFLAQGSTSEYLKKAKLVVAINSTVVLESLTNLVPTITFGKGIFSSFSVTSETQIGEPFKLPEINRDGVEYFLYQLIFRRQISLDDINREPNLLKRLSPFFEENTFKLDKKKLHSILKGDIMLHIGNSKIAKSAMLDVEKEGSIVIGNDCEVRHNAVLEVVGRYNGSIQIGEHCVIGVNNWLQGSGEITIGNDVIMGPNVCLVSTNHQYDDCNTPIARQPLETGYIRIENDVWIGANTTVAYNVTIGAHSIIGANSFVNKDVPPYSIVAGSPAKILRSRKEA